MKTVLNQLVIEPIIEKEETTKAGIILVNKSSSVNKGKVIEVGKEVLETKVNDIVYYHQYAGTEVMINDKTFIVIKQSDIILIL